MPGESVHADVAGPILPMGIGKAKYVLVVMDELTRFSWIFPKQKKAQTARLRALLIQRINTQIQRPGEPGVRRLHTDQGGEFTSTHWRSLPMEGHHPYLHRQGTAPVQWSCGEEDRTAQRVNPCCSVR